MTVNFLVKFLKKLFPGLMCMVLILLLLSKLEKRDAGLRSEVPTKSLPRPSLPVINDRKWMKVIAVQNTDVKFCAAYAFKFPDWQFVIFSNISAAQQTFKNCILHPRHVSSESEQDFSMLFQVNEPDVVVFLQRSVSEATLDHILSLVTLEPFTTLQIDTQRDGVIDVGDEHYNCDGMNKARDSVTYSTCDQLLKDSMLSVVPATSADKISCDKTAPVVSITRPQLSYSQLHGTVFGKHTLWAIGFQCKTTAAYPKTSLVLQITVQLLLHKFDGKLVFYYNDELMQSSQAFGGSSDDLNIKDIVQKSDSFAEKSLSDTATSMVEYLFEKKFISQSCRNFVSTWISTRKLNMDRVLKHTQVGSQKKAFFHPHANSTVYLEATYKELSHVYDSTCSVVQSSKYSRHMAARTVNLTKPWVSFPNILLLIVFNNQHYENIPYLELLYRPFFPHILYCGPGYAEILDKLSRSYNLNFISYAQVETQKYPGSLNYECLIQAMTFDFQTDGVLVISDDMLLLIHQFIRLNPKSIWFIPNNELRIQDVVNMRECRLGMCTFRSKSFWFEDYASQIKRLLHYMSTQNHSQLVQDCYKTFFSEEVKAIVMLRGYSDIVYIPRQYHQEFSELAQVFLKHDIFLELAYPTILKCLTNMEHLTALQGLAVWSTDRDKPWLFFSAANLGAKHYYHPVKWSPLLNRSEMHKKFYCSHVLAYNHDKYGRLIAMDERDL